MIKRFGLIAGLVTFISTTAQALTPPFGAKMLKEQSDLIVLGGVGGKRQNGGIVESNDCADTVKYTAALTVTKVCMGKAKPGDVLPVVIFHKDYKRGCVGDQDASLDPGDQGLYYLRKGDDEGTWRPVHWDGVKLKEAGKPMPSCP
ncbi:MAG TPA: hypothetical protein VLJ37_08750 [bacterium]|nr:hypothetical protein [bacterium]